MAATRKRLFLVVQGGGLRASIALQKVLRKEKRRRELLTGDISPLAAALGGRERCDVLCFFVGASPPTDLLEAASRIVKLGGRLELRCLRPSSSPVTRVALIARGSGLALENELAAIARHAPGGLKVYGRSVPRTWPPVLQAWVAVNDPSKVCQTRLGDVKLAGLKQVYLGAGVLRAAPILRKQFLREVLVNSLCEFLELTEDTQFKPHNPNRQHESKSLFVFPARMLPANRAFLARGLDMITHLNGAGRYTDVLVFGPMNKDADRIRAALECITPRAFESPLRRGEPTGFLATLAAQEEQLREKLKLSGSPPSRFADREHAINVASNIDAVVETARNGRYKAVILTGAWFSKPVARLRKALPQCRILCDTHDVFFIVDRDVNNKTRRLSYSASLEKRREVAALNRFDAVVAISASDADNMRAAGVRVPILTAPGSFEYALLDPPGPERLGHFGYIGTSNTPNRRALALLAKEWWPQILDVLPDAKLHLAGPICQVALAEQLAKKYRGAVTLHGRVASVRDFYREVHTVLAPIVVQGGLNFKSVEALMGGRNLVCTELGARCLGPGTKGLWVVQGPDEVARATRGIVAQGVDREAGLQIQRAAHERFGESSGYAELDAWLDANL